MGWMDFDQITDEKVKQAITVLFNDYVLDIKNAPKNVEDLKIYLKCQIMKSESEIAKLNKRFKNLLENSGDNGEHIKIDLHLIQDDIERAKEKIKLNEGHLNFIAELESLFSNSAVIEVIKEQQKQRKESLQAIKSVIAEHDKNNITGDGFGVLNSTIDFDTLESTERLIEMMILSVATSRVFPDKFHNMHPAALL